MSVSLVKATRINYVHPDRIEGFSVAQVRALRSLCGRYGVPFDPSEFHPTFDLPSGWVAGWVGTAIYVGASPDGDIHS